MRAGQDDAQLTEVIAAAVKGKKAQHAGVTLEGGGGGGGGGDKKGGIICTVLPHCYAPPFCDLLPGKRGGGA